MFIGWLPQLHISSVTPKPPVSASISIFSRLWCTNYQGSLCLVSLVASMKTCWLFSHCTVCLQSWFVDWTLQCEKTWTLAFRHRQFTCIVWLGLKQHFQNHCLPKAICPLYTLYWPIISTAVALRTLASLCVYRDTRKIFSPFTKKHNSLIFLFIFFAIIIKGHYQETETLFKYDY